MVRLARSEVIDPNEVTIAHVINRTVRRCFLFGDDPISGKNFDHRKAWIEGLLKHFAAHFGIDLLCYSILSNHYHLILRTRPDIVSSWDDTEIARRWLKICPRRKINGKPGEPSISELDSIRNCPEKVAEIRSRLSSISWWMRLLNQRVAQRANKEDDESGRFWQDRYRAIRLIDEESLVACAAYVELNPIRAGIADTLEQSDHTSIQCRIASEVETRSAGERRDAFLAKLTLDDTNPFTPVSQSETGLRCSDKGFLPISTSHYFELLDWTVRQLAIGKKIATPRSTPSILHRLGLTPSNWQSLVTQFSDCFCHIAGKADRVETMRSHRTKSRFNMRQCSRQLMGS
ncbi:MAG: hypothetical protein AAFX06_15705 [Planctomycetota bacterium]